MKNRAAETLTLFFARRVNAPDGQFLGLVLAAVDMKFLSAFYQAAGEHVKQAVTLLRRDGTMLIRYPNPEAAIDVKLPQNSPWYDRVAEGGGNYITSGTLDSIPALVTVHTVTAYPLVVDIVMSERDIFAGGAPRRGIPQSLHWLRRSVSPACSGFWDVNFGNCPSR